MMHPAGPSSKKGREPSGGSKPNGKAWEALGLNAAIARALALRGFRNPTPIQRATLPLTLDQPAKDVLGMARTGSGKTFAYILPILQRMLLSPGQGPRGLILCPNRELAYQILKAGKELSRSLPRNGDAKKKGLKWTLAIGGDGMEEQFAALSSDPDIIIATPGRFLHLAVEMKLDLRSVEVVVYDEADRLFEMGFSLQLREIIHRLPSTRQSLLFSATLPAAVTEFAKAGLSNPTLVRLDADQKISPDLRTVFLQTSPADKLSALTTLLEDIINIPLEGTVTGKSPQAIIFVATKHHAEYLNALLEASGYICSMVYGSLDQVARHRQLDRFRKQFSSLLIVTDVAARGLDIPILEHVINFDLPSTSRVFVHRVGRTARAGRKGTAWSLVSTSDLPYYFDLEDLADGTSSELEPRLNRLPRETLDDKNEFIASLVSEQPSLVQLAEVMNRAQKMYERSRNKAGMGSLRKAKEFKSSSAPIFVRDNSETVGLLGPEAVDRAALLAKLGAFQPKEKVLEGGRRIIKGESGAAVPPVKLKQSDLKPFELPTSRKTYKDEAFCLPERHNGSFIDPYSISGYANFALEAQKASIDLLADETTLLKPQKASQLRWDRKKKRFARDQSGQKSKDMIRSESGAMIPISYDSGRFAKWQKGGSRKASRGREDGEQRPVQDGLKSARDIQVSRASAETKRTKNARPPSRGASSVKHKSRSNKKL